MSSASAAVSGARSVPELLSMLFFEVRANCRGAAAAFFASPVGVLLTPVVYWPLIGGAACAWMDRDRGDLDR